MLAARRIDAAQLERHAARLELRAHPARRLRRGRGTAWSADASTIDAFVESVVGLRCATTGAGCHCEIHFPGAGPRPNWLDGVTGVTKLGRKKVPPRVITEIKSTPLRLAMLGMIDGNGHPWSWSAIVNGYDRDKIAACPYPVIPQYMNARPAGSVGIPGARVTHLWTDRAEEAPPVAAAALIPHVVARPEDVIGDVDAVLIATDDGFDHVERVRPFVAAGLPVFVDKPLALTIGDLRTFIGWRQAGARIMSSSGLRYAPELDPLRSGAPQLGALRWISAVSCKTWERYGIHLLEPVFCLLGPGFVSVRLESGPGLEVAHLVHGSGVEVTLPVIKDGGATFGTMHLCGTAGQTHFKFSDTYTAFRRQIVSFIDSVRSGVEPYPFSETVELMAVLIAGIVSKTEGGRRVPVAEIQSQL